MSIKTIHSFKAAALDYARPNRYEVEMALPTGVIDALDTPKDIRKILLNCSSAILPGKSLGTFEHRTEGPLRSMPYDRIYNPLTLTFYADTELREWKFFQDWITFISNNNSQNYMSFYKDYIANVTIGQLDMLSRQTRYINIKEAYPISVSDIQYSYAEGDTIIEFSVEFKYHSYTDHKGSFALSDITEFLRSDAKKFLLDRFEDSIKNSIKSSFNNGSNDPDRNSKGKTKYDIDL